jgi:hypothetical protein
MFLDLLQKLQLPGPIVLFCFPLLPEQNEDSSSPFLEVSQNDKKWGNFLLDKAVK